MLKNYFKTAFRSLLKNKAFTAINIIGLAIGISAAMVIYLIVRYDFSFDKQHPEADRIFRVVSDFSYQGQPSYTSGVPANLGAAVKNEVTGLQVVAPFFGYGYDVKVTIPNGTNVPHEIKKQNKLIVTDGSYVDLLSLKWLAGSRKQAFKNPNQVVLTAKQANLYFPGISYAEMMGRQVVYEDTLSTTVSGIVEDIKGHTDFTFHDFISLATANAKKGVIPDYDNPSWTSTNSANQLLIKLNPNTPVSHIKKQVNTLYHKYQKTDSKTETHEFTIQPLNDIHFNSRYDNFDQRQANKTVLYSLLGIAAFLLLLGCINFINLTTAQSIQRAREIGVRKTIGGTRSQLIGQFLTETFVLAFAATLISGLLAFYLLKVFADFIPEGITYQMMFTGQMLAFNMVLIIVITLASGLYPAIMLSSYKPIQVMKGLDTSGKSSGQYLRKTLTVTQFIIAQFFVMATLLVGSQINFALNKDLGFSKDAILYISTPYKQVNSNRQQVYLNKLKAIPQIARIGTGGAPPSSGNTMSTTMQYKDGKKEIETEVFLKYADENYMPIYKFRLLAGRPLQAHDTVGAFVINQTYAKVLGFRDAKSAVGKMIIRDNKNVPIVGVVQDFHQKSLHVPIKPVVILTSQQRHYNRTIHLALKPQTGNDKSWAKAIKQMKKDWKAVYPEDDFEYTFMDESVARFYKAEQNTAKLLNWATGLSILISCLGLLGLAIHSTNQRTKEIGVRKVLGATVSQIVTLLSVDFVKLIVLAFMVSLPIAWYAMHQWLQRFEYHTNISLWIFAIAILSTVIVALFTMSLQTVKAAMANPVKSLRSE
ncbi:ABC transporter permease [Mucilaginibacter terrae]|uniref:ABC transporter permease n=1 Tax=Mucilaginibacter terrae TaxID=1955052 RepID=UPI00362921CA